MMHRLLLSLGIGSQLQIIILKNAERHNLPFFTFSSIIRFGFPNPPQVRGLLREFLSGASDSQRTGLLDQLHLLRHTATQSKWLGQHEVVGSSLLLGVPERLHPHCLRRPNSYSRF